MNMPVMGQQVRVYRNLTKKGYSVMDAKTRRVVCVAPSVTLSTVEFKVSDKGRERARTQGVRNVHAYAVGTFIEIGREKPHWANRVITYNPFKNESFIDPITKSTVKHARLVHLQDGKCYVL